MKTLGRTILLLGALLMLVGPAQASTYYTPFSLPWFQTVNTCIGGGRCGGTDNVIEVHVGYDFIGKITVYAHDNVGQSSNAALIVSVDGEPLGMRELSRNGGYVTFEANFPGSLVTFQSVHESGDFSRSEETFIRDIRIERQQFGQK